MFFGNTLTREDDEEHVKCGKNEHGLTFLAIHRSLISCPYLSLHISTGGVDGSSTS